MKFKEYLIEKINNSQNEADIVLHQIINNVDESHVDYDNNRLDFNVGIMVKKSAYSRLFITVLNSDRESVKLAKNIKRDGYTIVVYTGKYPSRMEIDSFISNKGVYEKIKQEIVLFIENYQQTKDEFRTTYETNREINTDENFEKLYSRVISEMKKRVEEYKEIAADINDKIEKTANEAEKQILVRSIEKLKDEYFGNTFKKFKRVAAETMDIDMTRFEKEYKKKFDTRLEDFYEYIVKL